MQSVTPLRTKYPKNNVMATATRSALSLLQCRRRFLCSMAGESIESHLHRSIRYAVDSGDHLQVLNLLSDANFTRNPFSFLSLRPPPLAAAVVADLLRSFADVRPRSLPYPAFSALLSLTLPEPEPNSFPLSVFLPAGLAVLQSTIRSGLPPPAETRNSLPSNWLALRRRRRCPRPSVVGILSSVRTLGFRPPDLNTLNYLISSLCASGEAEEAVAVLRGMSVAGIDPDSCSYCEVIEAVDERAAAELLREMVVGMGMVPKKRTVARTVAAMSAEGGAKRAAKLLRVLEQNGCEVGFEGYEAAAEGCLDSGEVVAAARSVAEMASRGFVPCIGVRRRVVEGLAAIGQAELAGELRRRLAKIRT